MIKSIIAGLFMLQATAFAAEKPERVPTKIEGTEELEKQLDPQSQEGFKSLKAILESHFSDWASFPEELPPSAFENQKIEPIIVESDLFKLTEKTNPSNVGENQKFTKEQLTSIAESAVFVVQDPTQPGKFDMWQVHSSLVTGRENIRVKLQESVAKGMRHITVEIPARLWGTGFPSIRRGFTNILNGMVEIVGLFIGLPEKHFTYTKEQVQTKIDELAKAGRAEFFEQEVPDTSFESVMADNEKSKDLGKRLAVLDNKVTEEWSKVKARVVDSIGLQLQSEGIKGEEFFTQLANQVHHKELEFSYQAILSDAELAKFNVEGQEDIRDGIVNHLRASVIIQELEISFSEKVKSYRASLLKELPAKHPIRSKFRGWVEKTANKMANEYYQKNMWNFYKSEVIPALQKANLPEQAAKAEATLKFLETHGPSLESKLSKEKQSKGSIVYEHINPDPKKWEVGLFDRWDENSQRIKRYEIINRNMSYKVDVAKPFWRWAAAYYRSKAYGRSFAYWTFYHNLNDGPLSLSSLSLFSDVRYDKEYEVDQNTKEIVKVNGQERSTLRAEIKEMYNYAEKRLADHKAKPNMGGFSKGVEGFFLNIYANAWLRTTKPAAWFIGKPLVVLGNHLITGSVALTHSLWMPFASLAQTLFWNPFVFDNLGTTHEGKFNGTWSRLLPVPKTILWNSATGAVNVAVGSVGAIAINVTSGIYHLAMGNLLAMGRGVLDSATLLAMNVFNRTGQFTLPRQDLWYMKRVKGQGLSEQHFHQVSPNLALTAVLAHLEGLELNAYAENAREAIDAPLNDAYQDPMVKAVAALLNMSGPNIQNEDDKNAFTALDKNRKERRKKLDAALKAREERYSGLLSFQHKMYNSVKLTQENLMFLVNNTAALTQKIYSARIFAGMRPEEVRKHWMDWRLDENDWNGRARQILASIFGSDILKSLEETDKSLVLHMQDPELDAQLEKLLSGEFEEGFIVNGLQYDRAELDARMADIRRYNESIRAIDALKPTVRAEKFFR